MAKSSRVVPSNKTQVNFNIDRDLLYKVKIIAAGEEVSNSDIYNTAVQEYVDNYEKDKGKIKPRPTKKG